MKNYTSKLYYLLPVLSLALLISTTCKKYEKSMLVSTGDVTSILTSSAEVSGEVIDLGTGATQYGHCIGTLINVTISDSKTQFSTPSAGGFTSQLNGLEAGTKYYVKAYLSNGTETVYGKEKSFTTLETYLPALSTTAVTSITETGASSGGNISNDGGASVTARGVCWSISASPTTADSKTTDGTGTGSYASSLTGLTASTTYYVRAYATNSAGTAYGNELSFTTSSVTPVIPTLSTTAVTSITETGASSGGNITDDGGASVTARGVCWSISTSPTTADSKTTDGTGTGSYASSLTGLTASTTYYVRAYATNSAGTAYGNELSFTTSSVTPVIPTLSTTAVTSITETGASSGGNITDDGGASVTARGVCWSISTSPTTDDSKTTDGAGIGSYASSLTGLTASTTYYVRAYATNNAGTAYGNELSFTTSSVTPVIPALSTTPVTSITETGASSGGNITDDGGASVTARGVCWSISASPTTTDSKTTDGTGTGSYASSLTGLTASTTYYVRAYATNNAGTAYGNELSFTTSSVTPVIPALSTTAVTSITETGASSGGNITDDGGASVTARGVCWSISASPTTTDSKTTDGTGTGSYASSLTGLTANTTYYVRAYATNSAGTAYGNELSFTTLQPPIIPVYVSSVVEDATPNLLEMTYDLTLANITPASSAFIVMVNGGGNTVNNTAINGTKVQLSLAIPVVYGDVVTVAYSKPVSNPIQTPEGGEAASITFQTVTNNVVGIPAIITTIVSNITTITANSGGEIIDDGGGSVTDRGVCWSTSPNPTVADSYTDDGNGPGSFISLITALTNNTTYYVRAYATNSKGTGYGNELTFKTFTGTVKDVENNLYFTVTIGTQVWMAQNLKTTRYIDGISIPLETDDLVWSTLSTPGYCWYNNDEATNKDTY